MNQTLRALCVALLVCLGMGMHAQHVITLGYCPDTLTANIKGMTLESTMRVQAAVRLPAARLQALRGAHIDSIRIATDEGITGVYVWVRPSLSQGAGTHIARIATTALGWNTAALKEPYTITGDEIYVGFNCTLPDGYPLYFDGETNENGCYAKVSEGEWENLSAYGLGSLCIQAYVSTDSDLPVEDVAIESLEAALPYTQLGQTAHYTAKVANYGEAVVAAPTLYFSTHEGDSTAVSPEAGAAIAPMHTYTYNIEIPTTQLVEGANNLRVWTAANDAYTPNNQADATLYCYAKSYPRKVLIEHFTTLPCVNCPYGLATLNALVNGRKDYVWVAHHVGYQTDELTVEASNAFTSYGATSAPLAMFDRTVFKSASTAGKPTVGIGYPNTSYGLQALQPDFETCAGTAAFVSVGIHNDYDAATRTLTTTVSGERSSLFNLFYPEANLTVELVEDQVHTTGQQKGSGAQIHNNVFRQALTHILGDAITWDGDTYTARYVATIPAEWNEEMLRVVAFVNRPENENDYAAVQVLNAEEQRLQATEDGIQGITLDPYAHATHTYYNLQGQRLSRAPQSGIYIEKVQTPQGTQVIKHLR